jgi:2-polyprenyl-3-methyl-5-hydroxy-6-metoxy-1,4-benzoquinol methylase
LSKETSLRSLVDRFGIWLSARQLRRWIPDFKNKKVADIGCGFQAKFARTLIEECQLTTLVDVSLATDLKQNPKIITMEGQLPQVLDKMADASQDVILCTSVLEHLWEPEIALAHFFRILRPEGICLINVPSWRGKFFLEFSAFQLGLSPADEMDDHKNYYDPKDLWPLLVRAGFRPRQIRCFKHKFGLNTFAVLKKGEN